MITINKQVCLSLTGLKNLTGPLAFTGWLTFKITAGRGGWWQWLESFKTRHAPLCEFLSLMWISGHNVGLIIKFYTLPFLALCHCQTQPTILASWNQIGSRTPGEPLTLFVYNGAWNAFTPEMAIRQSPKCLFGSQTKQGAGDKPLCLCFPQI